MVLRRSDGGGAGGKADIHLWMDLIYFEACIARRCGVRRDFRLPVGMLLFYVQEILLEQ